MLGPARPRALAPSRHGFTLIEVLIGLVLMAIVSAILFQLVIGSQRISQAQTERGAVQANARAGVLIVPNELRELGYSRQPSGSTSSDLREIGSNFVLARVMRGVGTTCGPHPTNPSTRILIRNGPAGDGRIWRGLRAPQVGDSIIIFIENETSTADDDRWKHALVDVVSAGTCVDGSAALQLTLDEAITTGTQPVGNSSDLRPGAPVYWYERLRYETYVDQGHTWLGLTVNSGTREPILGPLEDVSGLRFRYYRQNGTEVTDMNDRAEVRTIEVQVNGASSRLVRVGGTFNADLSTDSVRFFTRVALRNSLERP